MSFSYFQFPCGPKLTNIIRFHSFFHHIDNYRTEYFLFVTAQGIPATREIIEKQRSKQVELESEDEGDANAGEG